MSKEIMKEWQSWEDHQIRKSIKELKHTLAERSTKEIAARILVLRKADLAAAVESYLAEAVTQKLRADTCRKELGDLE